MDLRSSPTRTRWLLAAAATVALIVVAIAGGVMLRGDDHDPDRVDVVDQPDRPDSTPPPTPTTTPPATSGDPQTTVPTSANSSAGALDAERRTAIWPRPSSSVTFDTPEAAARSFALYYAFFQDPVVGTFRATDTGAGEVPVQAFAGGSATRVLVRQLGDGKWYVMGSLAPEITLSSPVAAAGLACPQQAVRGTALAFEGQVEVRIDAYQPDGGRVEIGRGYVTGSGSPPAGPFSGSIDCTYPTGNVEDSVVLTLWEESQADAPELTGTLQITTIRLVLPG